jgi:hypothetical protein
MELRPQQIRSLGPGPVRARRGQLRLAPQQRAPPPPLQHQQRAPAPPPLLPDGSTPARGAAEAAIVEELGPFAWELSDLLNAAQFGEDGGGPLPTAQRVVAVGRAARLLEMSAAHRAALSAHPGALRFPRLCLWDALRGPGGAGVAPIYRLWRVRGDAARAFAAVFADPALAPFHTLLEYSTGGMLRELVVEGALAAEAARLAGAVGWSRGGSGACAGGISQSYGEGEEGVEGVGGADGSGDGSGDGGGPAAAGHDDGGMAATAAAAASLAAVAAVAVAAEAAPGAVATDDAAGAAAAGADAAATAAVAAEAAALGLAAEAAAAAAGAGGGGALDAATGGAGSAAPAATAEGPGTSWEPFMRAPAAAPAEAAGWALTALARLFDHPHPECRAAARIALTWFDVPPAVASLLRGAGDAPRAAAAAARVLGALAARYEAGGPGAEEALSCLEGCRGGGAGPPLAALLASPDLRGAACPALTALATLAPRHVAVCGDVLVCGGVAQLVRMLRPERFAPLRTEGDGDAWRRHVDEVEAACGAAVLRVLQAVARADAGAVAPHLRAKGAAGVAAQLRAVGAGEAVGAFLMRVRGAGGPAAVGRAKLEELEVAAADVLRCAAAAGAA